ncbi:hypothetical protein D9M72_383580 [compost metagenome]
MRQPHAHVHGGPVAHRLDHGAGLLEHARGRQHRGMHFRVDLPAAGGLQPQADAQPAHVARQAGPGDVLRRQAHVVAGVGPGDRLHGERGIGHGARQRAEHARRRRRIHRHAAMAGLQAEHAAEAGGDAHRAADIGAQVDRAIAGRCRRARARAGTAGIAFRVPRIARQRVEARRRRAEEAEVRHGGLADHDRAGLAQARGSRGVGGRRRQHRRGAAQRRRRALRGDVFLQRHRHAVERAAGRARPPARFRGAGGVQRLLRMHQVHRANGRLPLSDAVQDGLHDFDRRQFALAVVAGQFDGAECVERLVHVVVRCGWQLLGNLLGGHLFAGGVYASPKR